MAHDYHSGVEGTNLASLVLGDLVLLVLVAVLGLAVRPAGFGNVDLCGEMSFLSFWSDCAKINVNVVRAPKSDSKLVRSQRDGSCPPGCSSIEQKACLGSWYSKGSRGASIVVCVSNP
jgi:hypothetical protein